MQVQFPIFILSLLVHTSIYLTSRHHDRRLRLFAGLAIVFNTWPAWFAGVLLSNEDGTIAAWGGLILVNAPYFLPLLSFLVYWRSQRMA